MKTISKIASLQNEPASYLVQYKEYGRKLGRCAAKIKEMLFLNTFEGD